LSKGGPIGRNLCVKMQFTNEARAPYIQIMEEMASMATEIETAKMCHTGIYDFAN